MPAEKILDKVTDAFTSRLKVPIISTYLSILVLFNWDVLYYLCFQKLPAACKIDEIKRIWGPVYWQRIIECIIMAFVVLCVFTMLNTFINYLMRWFYMRDKENLTVIEQSDQIIGLKLSIVQKDTEIAHLTSSFQNAERLANEYLEFKRKVTPTLQQGWLTEEIDKFVSLQPNQTMAWEAIDEFLTAVLNKHEFTISEVSNQKSRLHIIEELIERLLVNGWIHKRGIEHDDNQLFVPTGTLIRLAYSRIITTTLPGQTNSQTPPPLSGRVG